MTHIFAVAVLILLVAIGCGVWCILRHTMFVVSVVARNVADADELEEAPPQVLVPQDAADDTRPMGFGVRLRERN